MVLLWRQISSQRGRIFTACRGIYSKRSMIHCGRRGESGYVFVRVAPIGGPRLAQEPGNR